VARHSAHPAVVAAGPVAEDRGKLAHGSGPGVPNVVGGMDVTKEHEPRWDLGDPLTESRATHQIHLVVMVIGCIEDPIRWAVRDQDVEAFRNLVPDSVDGAAVSHVGPVSVAGREWASPDP